jgi:ribonucleoside-diphosphate reductase alpha chain
MIDNQGTTFEDSFSEEVWRTTYKDHNDITINDTIRRVAKAAASVEDQNKQDLWENNFYDMLSGFKCTTGGRIYSNAGTEWNGTTLMNCFVSPRDNYDIDSLDAILKDVSNQCQTLKSEGGWGQNFSFIRPRGSFIGGIGVESPGAVKYMEIYDKTSDVITAGSGKKSEHKKAKGKIRKGAMMGVMDVWHPDIIEFITAKQQPGRLTKFNISVNCTDEFMEKVVKVLEIERDIEYLKNKEIQVLDNKDVTSSSDLQISILENEKEILDQWSLRFPDTKHPKYKEEWQGNIKDWESKGYPTTTHRVVSATWLWNLIMESTYNRAEPGVLFLDRANYFGPLNYLETIYATNPCGEQTLAPGGVCNLGSLNLTQFINKDRTGFDLEKIAKYTKYLNRFLDNVSSLSNAPLPEYTDSMKNKRRVGIGILGWGSALFMLKVRFGSEQAAELREQIMSTIAKEAYKSSIDLAEEKGMFTYCNPELHAKGPFIQSLNLSAEYMKKLQTTGIRNSSLLSIQPTGNTSILANVVSGGLEPIFMPEYIRTVIVGTMPEEIADVCPKWYEGAWHETEMFKIALEGDEEILRGVGPNGTVYKIDKNRGLTKEVLCQDYGVRWLSERNEWDPSADWAVTTLNLGVNDHVTDLKGFARWVDSAMSKTVNVPNDYSFEDFQNIYLDSFNSGVVKGVTTYRSGTMTTVLSAKEETLNGEEEIILEDVKVPNQAPAMVSTIKADGKKWYLTTILDNSGVRPIAFFVHTNHYEKTVTTHDAVERLIKLATDKGIPSKWIEDTQKKMDIDNNPTKIARAISLNLRHGVLIKNVVAVLDHVEDIYVGSFLFQIRKFLSTYIKDGEKVEGEKCSNCGGTNIIFSEGCKRCNNCGSSRCG